MKKLMMLTVALAAVSTYAHAGQISPEDLYQRAKRECPESATTPEGWDEIRACIADAKVRILHDDPRVAKLCKDAGKDHAECVDWVYAHPDATHAPSLRDRLKESLDGKAPRPLPPENPNVVREGKQHQEIERRNIERANRNDPRSNRSTITGTVGGHTGNVKGGGVAPADKVSRPDFLGGGRKPGGVRAGGAVTTSEPADLKGLKDAVVAPEDKK